MCIFHLIDGHTCGSCPEMIRYIKMNNQKETIEEPPTNESPPQEPGNLVSYFLEYELDLERGDILVTLEEPSCIVLMRSQQNPKFFGYIYSPK